MFLWKETTRAAAFISITGLVTSTLFTTGQGYMVPKINLLEPWPTLQRTNTENSETNIPRKGIARSQSQFPHACVCERFIYSAYSAAGNMWTDPGNI